MSTKCLLSSTIGMRARDEFAALSLNMIWAGMTGFGCVTMLAKVSGAWADHLYIAVFLVSLIADYFNYNNRDL